MNTIEMRRILADVKYPGISFHVASVANTDIPSFMQIVCKGTCNVTNEPMDWKGRKWMLSRHMTKSEVIATAFKAIITAVEHETREKFLYKGAMVFGPHMDVEQLAKVANRTDERA